MTGDHFLQQGGAQPPDVVIIDTEGADTRVIRGLSGAIAQARPIIFFENLFETADSIAAALPTGYSQLTVCDGSGRLIEGLHFEEGHNSVFVPLEKSVS